MTLQYSLAELLAATLLVAVVLGMLRWSQAAWQAFIVDGTGMLAATVLVVGAVAVVTYGFAKGAGT